MTRSRGTAPAGTGPGSGRTGPGSGRTGPGVAGITVRLSAGAYLLATLVVLVSALTLPQVAPGYPAVAYLAATAGLVIGLLASLTVHELAHALIARRHGADIGDLRIGLSGTASHARHDFASPRAAWRAAAAGPAASLAAAAVSAGATFGLAAAGAGVLAVTTYAAIIWLNIALTVVNALPGAGLDGGRIAYALAWGRSGDRARASVTAGRIGQFTGALLVAGGVALVVLGNLAGLLAVLFGLMMASTSRAQSREVLAITALAGLRVRDVLPQAAAEPAASWQTVQAFLDREFGDAGGRSMGRGLSAGGPVAFGLRDFHGDAGGVVTLTQLAAVPPERRDSVRLADIATPAGDVVTTTLDEQLSRLLSRLATAPRTPAALHTAGHALVLDEAGRPAGVLTPADFSRASQLAALDPHRQAA